VQFFDTGAPLEPAVLSGFALALGLGLLVGLQRERVAASVAGIRTFALVTWLGSCATLLAGEWTIAAGWIAVALLAVGGHGAKVRITPEDPGLTTEVALLLMFAVGALAMRGDFTLAIVLTGGVALLLHWKDPLHAFVRRIGEDDFSAIMRFVLIALVVLPVLPNRPMGPFAVLNPFDIWLMVVLIVGIGLASYVAYKVAGPRLGPLLGGLLGGLVSSTATSVSYARRAAAQPEHTALCALVIAIASGVVFPRILIEVAAVAPALLGVLAAPLGVVLGAALLGGLALARRSQPGDGGPTTLGNPAEVGPALAFGILYAGVLLAVAFLRERFGDAGVYGLAFLTGLTDVDAITLSSARLTRDGSLDPDLAWRAILLAAMANLLLKGGLVAVLGPASLGRSVALAFAPPLVAGALVLLLWPAL
jgi:uncharacterized membrane protein (DUF4010 family)